MKRYPQLTYEQRCQVEVLKKRHCSQKTIAETIGCSQSTISRELARNSGMRGYRHKQAQQKALSRRNAATKATKMTTEMISLVSEKLQEKLSPEQISGWLLEEKRLKLSHERIHQYIWADKASGGTLYQHLRRNGRKYQKCCNGKTSRGQIKNCVSIEERPEIVDQKGRIGDWEIDTVIGKGRSGVLVTIVERSNKFTLCARVNSKSARDVTDATIALLAPYKDKALHSITADNGKEFAYHEKITEKLGVPVYFAHPYHSWERGLNENTNGLLRLYWPKNTDFKKVSPDEVQMVLTQLNQRPRNTLGFQTPYSLMQNHLKTIEA